MARLFSLMDEKKRDAHVAMEAPKRKASTRFVGPHGAVRLERLVRGTDETSYEGLLRKAGSPAAVAAAIAAGDPEIPLGLVGRRLGEGARIHLREDGSILGIARYLEVVTGADGTEKSRKDFVDTEANVVEDGAPLPWTGRLIAIDEAIRKFAFVRKQQIRHVSGLTFEFLFDIAKKLHDEKKLLVVGAGPKGQQPLVFSTNGAPYRGFLEGRIVGDAYLLVLHLSNLELKSLAQGAS